LAADYYQDQTTSEVIRIAGEDPNFDSLLIEADVHNMHQVATIMNADDILVDYWKVMAKAGKRVVEEQDKPVLVIIPEVAYPIPRAEAWNIFVEAELPVFRNINEAVSALSRVYDYYEIRDRRS
jgi:hypothetical protein